MDSLGPSHADHTNNKQSSPPAQEDEDNSRTALLGPRYSTFFQESHYTQLSTSKDQSVQARLLPVILSVLVISFGCFIHGSSVVYGGIAVVGLENASKTLKPNSNQTELGFDWDNTQDSAWLGNNYVLVKHFSSSILIVGISSIGMIIGSLVAAPVSNTIGRKITCIVGIGAIYAISYTIFVFPVNIGLLYLSRLMMGLGLGVSQSISTIYISEVATLETRPNLAVIPAMTGCLGVVSCQVLAKFLDYTQLAMVYASINIPFVLLILLIPESPVYLLSRNKLEQTHRVLRRLRGPRWDVVKEAMEIKRSIEGEGDSPRPSLTRQFLDREIVKPLLMAVTLMFFFQTSGINL